MPQGLSQAYFCLARADSSPQANWSGQEVLLAPQRMPFKRWIASWAGIPTTRAEIPWRLPLQPPRTYIFWMMPASSTSTRISWEQTPRGRNVYVMVEISSFHDIARLGYHIPPGMARGGTI